LEKNKKHLRTKGHFQERSEKVTGLLWLLSKDSSKTFTRAGSSLGLTKILIWQRLRSRRLWETGRSHNPARDSLPDSDLSSHVCRQLVVETPKVSCS